MASDLVAYQAVRISTQRLRGSEDGKTFFVYGNINGERDRGRQNLFLFTATSTARETENGKTFFVYGNINGERDRGRHGFLVRY